MPRYTQTDRAMRVEVPSLGEDVLLLEGFSGEEHVSEPFEFTLQLLSEETGIDPTAVLREPMILTLRLPDGSDRKIHGICNRFNQGGRDEDLTSYEAEIVPWLWFLSLNNDCKIFQQKTVLEIIEEVFSKYGQADFGINCVESYAPREFCVQYRESDLDFVSRLMEEEGIFYFFQHSGEGHKLILADDRSAVEACEGQDIFRVEQSADTREDEDVITELEREHQVYTAKVTITDYDFAQPSMNLESSASDEDYEELYDYPGKYSKLSDGERYASLRLQERAAAQEVVRGVGKCRAFRSGFEFDLSEHYRADSNQTYFLKSVWHSGHGGGYRTSKGEVEYSNEFECVPASIPFRPPSRTPKPVVQGSQTAMVVGPSGEEIFTEKNGQVKIQFHWDRDGQRDENSSCWVRVSHPWAGRGWGSVSIPRIGQEVIVDFLEGDPDRPIITGRVYNSEAMPPYPLPEGAVVSGVKSDTHKGSGFNEISMDDTAGQEKVTIHAQKDMSTTVLNDLSESVGHNHSESVTNDHTLNVDNEQRITVKNNRRVQSTHGGITEGAKNDIAVASETGMIQLDAKTNLFATATDNDAVVQSFNGKMHAVGKTEALLSGTDEAKVLSTGGPVTIQGSTFVEIKTDGGHSVKVEGGKVTVTSAGCSVEVSDGGVKVTGTTIELN